MVSQKVHEPPQSSGTGYETGSGGPSKTMLGPTLDHGGQHILSARLAARQGVPPAASAAATATPAQRLMATVPSRGSPETLRRSGLTKSGKDMPGARQKDSLRLLPMREGGSLSRQDGPVVASRYGKEPAQLRTTR